MSSWGRTGRVQPVGILILVILFLGVARKIQATGAGSPTPDCSRGAGSLPDPSRPPGTADPSIPIEHIVILMQENRSFDHYFGQLNQFGYNGEVDGLTEEMSNPDIDGTPIAPFHQSLYCTDDTDHEWNGSHLEWNLGQNDRFVIQNTSDPEAHDGIRAMSYYDQTDIPYYYALANAFSIGDRSSNSSTTTGSVGSTISATCRSPVSSFRCSSPTSTRWPSCPITTSTCRPSLFLRSYSLSPPSLETELRNRTSTRQPTSR